MTFEQRSTKRHRIVYLICTALLSVVMVEVCSGFDLQKYLKYRQDFRQDLLHYSGSSSVEDVNAMKAGMATFVEDVNKSKAQMVAGNLYGNVEKRPFDWVFPACLIHCSTFGPAFSSEGAHFWDTKFDVLERMITEDVAKSLEKCGIARDAPRGKYSAVLRVDIYVLPQEIGTRTVYLTEIRTTLREELTDPTTDHAVLADTWSDSDIHIHLSKSSLESYLLRYSGIQVYRFLDQQYCQHVTREAWSQLRKAGKLPPWLDPKPAEGDKIPNSPATDKVGSTAKTPNEILEKRKVAGPPTPAPTTDRFELFPLRDPNSQRLQP